MYVCMYSKVFSQNSLIEGVLNHIFMLSLFVPTEGVLDQKEKSDVPRDRRTDETCASRR